MMYGHSPRPSTTPFIPTLPSPENLSIPPLIPSPREQPKSLGGAWAQQHRQPAYPYYPASPYGASPYVPPVLPSGYPTPGMRPQDTPGSYFPSAGGFSPDYTGYPAFGTPWVPPQQVAPQTPWGHPGTGYSAYQQPLPPGYAAPNWGHPYGAYPPNTPAWGAPPPLGAWPQTPAWGAAPPPAAAAPDTGMGDFRWTSNMDRVNPFAEGPHYGPVLEPFLAKVVGAHIRINPLLAPPPDTADDYLRWDMSFGTSNCYRTTDSRRSWTKGRGEPATHPRLSSMRMVSRTFPWMITVHARDKSIGITCGDVIERISHELHANVVSAEYGSVSKPRKKAIWQAYQRNRSTQPGVPGGELGEGLKRLDWLCGESMFGGIIRSDDFVREKCGDVLPCTFELKCLPSYPLTAEELRDQERRTREGARRTRSRAASRATSASGTSGASGSGSGATGD